MINKASQTASSLPFFSKRINADILIIAKAINPHVYVEIPSIFSAELTALSPINIRQKLKAFTETRGSDFSKTIRVRSYLANSSGFLWVKGWVVIQNITKRNYPGQPVSFLPPE